MADIQEAIVVSGIHTNIIDPVDGKSKNYKEVTTWWDGTPMNNSKVDGTWFRRKGTTYLRQVIDKEGELFLEKDTVAQLRALSSLEILFLRGGVYKGVKLNGYYQAGDTPAPIEYYLSDTTESDDGGSVFEVGDVKLEHDFVGEVDISYFGCSQQDLAFDNAPQLQRAADLRLPLVVRNIDVGKYYFIDARIRLYNSIKGIGLPQIKVNPEVNEFVTFPGYQLDRYTAFTVTNKIDDNWLIIEGLDIDGWYSGDKTTGSEFEHNIHLSCVNNIIIRDNILRNPCGDNIYCGKNTAGQGAPQVNNCSNIYIYNNRMTNQGRCGVALVSTYNTKIYDNYIEKLWTYVCPIDLEPNGEQVDLLVQSTTIENNTIIARMASYAINVYGATDSSYGADPYPAVDYSTKDVIIRNNRLVAVGQGVNIAASWGKVVNVFIQENIIDAPQMVNVSGTYRTSNIVIDGNAPMFKDKSINIGTFQYTDKIVIKNNISNSTIGQSILCSRANGISIEGNEITATGEDVPAIRFANNVSEIKILNRNKITSEASCIRFNNTSVIEGFTINNNILRSTNDHIILSNSVVIPNAKIGLNDWSCDSDLMFLVNSPYLFTDSEDKFFDGKREFYVSSLPSPTELTNKENGFVYNKKISGLTQYNNSTAEADKYIYFNGSLIGIGFKGEWFGDGTLPSANTKIGHRYTNVVGGSGNTFYIREGGVFRPVQTIAAGTTAQRPTNAAVGFRYWDTSLSRPVYWNGTSWVNSSPDATPTVKGLVNQATAIADITVADATDEATAIALANANKAKINEFLAALRTAGILAT